MAKNIKIMAVAGALGLAALPMAGVFADTGDTKNVIDNITVTVEESCNFIGENIRSHKATATDVAADGTLTEGVSDVIDSYGTDFSGNALPGAPVSFNSGANTHAFTVRCNTNGGYTVTAKAEGLKHDTDNTKVISYEAVGTYDETAKDNSMGAWNVAISATGATSQSDYNTMTDTEKAAVDYILNNAVSTSEATIITKKSSTGNSGTGFTATYKAYVGEDTPTGTYSGTVKYTLLPAA